MPNSLQPHGLQHTRPPCPSPSPRVSPSSWSLLSGHLILWCPTLFLPSVFPSIRDFSNESSICIQWQKYWGFSFSISPSSEYSGLISLKIDWFDLLSVQGTFTCLLWHHSSGTSIFWHSGRRSPPPACVRAEIRHWTDGKQKPNKQREPLQKGLVQQIKITEGNTDYTRRGL